MKAISIFHLWPRLHEEILYFLDHLPDGALNTKLPGSEMDVASTFRHIAAVEMYWLNVVLNAKAECTEQPVDLVQDAASLYITLSKAFAATDEILQTWKVEDLANRKVTTNYPVKNALEALTLCHLHTVHHRSEIVSAQRSIDANFSDWL